MKRTIFAICAIFILAVVGLSFAQEKPEPKYWYSFSVNINLKSDTSEAQFGKAFEAVRARFNLAQGKRSHWNPASQNEWRKAKERAEAQGQTYPPESQFVMRSRYSIGGGESKLPMSTLMAIQQALIQVCESPDVEYSWVEFYIHPQYFDVSHPDLRSPVKAK
jgi:hypothetical protein